MSGLREWLDLHGFSKYADVFARNDIDLDVLPDLSDDDLEKLGILLGDRRRILKAAASLDVGAKLPGRVATSPAVAREAERRQLTVMFCDLVGSTGLSSTLDPEDFRDVVQTYQETCAAVVARFDGHIAKYLGDGLLVYFGYPVAHEDDAERAVRAGLGIIAAVSAVEPGPGIVLATRIGIATGRVVAGDLVGERVSEAGAVLGDVPNLAARLQEIAGPDCVVVGAVTRRLSRGMFAYDDLGRHRLKGIDEPVQVWRAVSERAVESRFEAQREQLTGFVGRETEIGLLLERWERARNGEGQVVLLSGEAGIGKSRVAETLQRRLDGERYTLLRYQCSPHHTSSALYPVIRLLELMVAFAPDDTAETKIDKLEVMLEQTGRGSAEVMPLFAALLSIPTGSRYPVPDTTPQQHKEKTLTALVDQLVGHAARQAVLCVFEDAHWIDPTTEELLELIVARVRELPVLLVITCRPEYSPPWPPDRHMTTLTLEHLTGRQSAEMVAALTTDRMLPAELLDRIVAKSDGVPLFVEELTKSVLEAGFRPGAGGEPAASSSELTIPATVQDALTARLDRLAAVKETAQMGAAIGREFSYELIAAITPLNDGDLKDALERLCSSGLVHQQGPPSNPAFVFKHALVQDTAYQSLLKKKRREIHGAIARALEDTFPRTVETQPEFLAHHFTEAGMADQAIACWLRAGRRAAGRSENREAVRHLTRGLDLLKDTPATLDRVRRELEFRIALGTPLQALKGQAATETAEAFRRARALCEQLGDSRQLSMVLQGLHAYHIVRGELPAASDLAAECYRVARQDDEPASLAGAHFVLGCVAFHRAELVPARDRFEKAVRLHDPSPSAPSVLPAAVDLGVFARSYLSHTLWYLGDPEQAIAWSRAAAADADAGGHLFSQALAAAYAAMLMQLLGDAGAATREAEKAIALCTEHKFAYYLAWARMIRGWARAREGQEGEGIREMREALDALRATGAGLRYPYYLGLLAESLGSTGQVGEASELIARARAVAAEHGEHVFDAGLHRIEAELLAQRRRS